MPCNLRESASRAGGNKTDKSTVLLVVVLATPSSPPPVATGRERAARASASVSEPYFIQDAVGRARARAESEAREQQSRQVSCLLSSSRLPLPLLLLLQDGKGRRVSYLVQRRQLHRVLFPPSSQRLGGRSTSTNLSETEEAEGELI
jgi:hypothetical protein